MPRLYVLRVGCKNPNITDGQAEHDSDHGVRGLMSCDSDAAAPHFFSRP